jgi:hypothetical protein
MSVSALTCLKVVDDPRRIVEPHIEAQAPGALSGDLPGEPVLNG